MNIKSWSTVRETVLVTGGCGFIGSHLLQKLSEIGHSIVCIDNLVNGVLTSLKSLQDVTFYDCDIRNSSEIDKIFKLHRPTYVVHLAALTQMFDLKTDPEKHFATSVDGTYNVISSAARFEVKKVIYANSASVYGRSSDCASKETSKVNPQNFYALFKLLGEQLVLEYGQLKSIPVVSVRLFNQYGERASALFGLFVNQIMNGRKLTITGDGTQRRDFVYVGDTVHAICEILGSELFGEILNIGTGTSHSIIDLANALDQDYEFIPRASDEPDLIWADISKLQELLPSAVPKSPFSETVKQVITKIKLK